MLANVQRIEQGLTERQNLENVARSQPAGVSFTISNAVSSLPLDVPEWIGCEMASLVLGVSELHVRVLARDGVLEMCEAHGRRVVKTSSVLEFQQQASDLQYTFASDAANMHFLRRHIVEQIA